MTSPNGTQGKLNWVMVDRKVGDLTVDPNVQRGAKKARIEKMSADFRPEALGILTTSARTDGLIHLIDGQHRYRAAERAGYTGTFQTKEYFGLDITQEAALFALLNKTEKVSPVDSFLVAVVEGQPRAVDLSRALADNGWVIANTASSGKLSAVRSLERVYDLDPAAARKAIAVVTAAFGHQPAAVQGSLVEGLGRMLARYGDAVDLTDLAKRLPGFPGGPDGLVGHARGQSMTGTGNLSTHVARVITKVYNQRRRTSALPDWP